MNASAYSYEYQRSEKINSQITALLNELPLYCSEYIHDKRAVNKYQPRTYVAYLGDILHFFRYLCSQHEAFMETAPDKIPVQLLNTLTRKDLIQYLSYISFYKKDGEVIENTESGKARKLAAIRSLFAYLVREGQMNTNPATDVETPSKRQSDVVFMTTPQQQALLQNIESGYAYSPDHNFMHYSENNKVYIRDVAIIYLFLGTGIRVSELVALDFEDIDFLDRSIHVSRKGGKEQTLYFSSDVEAKLLAYLDYSRPHFLYRDENGECIEVDALFLSTRKKRITVRSVQSLLEKYTSYTFGVNPDKKITPHKLRSTYATNLLEETNDVALVADSLGHEDLSVVSRYGKVQNRQRAAIDIRNKY